MSDDERVSLVKRANIRIAIGFSDLWVTPLWPEDTSKCDGSHPARTTGHVVKVINLYDFVAHCQHWAQPTK